MFVTKSFSGKNFNELTFNYYLKRKNLCAITLDGNTQEWKFKH